LEKELKNIIQTNKEINCCSWAWIAKSDTSHKMISHFALENPEFTLTFCRN
jgi:hypothetical protein